MHFKDIHETLQDILQLPQTIESLRSHPIWVDVYGMFLTSILALKEEHSAAQMAIRKQDESKVGLYIKAKKKMTKEMEELVRGINCVTQHATVCRIFITIPPQITFIVRNYCMFQDHTNNNMIYDFGSHNNFLSVADAELVGVIADVMSVTVSVSVAQFNWFAISFASRKLSWTQMVKLSRKTRRVKGENEGIEELEEKGIGVESLWNLKKEGVEEVRSVLKRMQDLEGCICGMESVSEKVFRASINLRT